ncbi:MAG: SMP-30/gluconolactonase/LRE family protein [Fuerstiella sp.]|nr:SMP-30/gluconolactonase/LRE family protein [Fuerstiella sp.]
MYEHTSHRRTSRRQFIGTTAAAAAVARFSWVAKGAPTEYAGLNSDRYLGKVQVLAHVQDEVVFTEGPAVDRAGNVFFTNVPASRILKWTPHSRELSVFRSDSHGTNGLYFAPDGSLLACEGEAGRVTRTNSVTGEIEVLANGYGGKPLAKPNDLCMDDQGRIYFTSRSSVTDPAGENVKAVYRIDTDGSIHQILAWPDVHMPNGIVTSPDNRQLYLIEAHPDANHHRDIRVYDLNADGTVTNGRVLIDFYPGRSGDGMCIDAEGNLYVAAGLHDTRNTSETLDTQPGIHVVSPTGKLLAFRETPEDTLTNCTFGGSDLKTLYIACGSHLLSLRTEIPGKADYRPDA